MSINILIITIITSIAFGFVTLVISFYLQRKYELNFVKSYFYHQIFIFLFGFYGLLGTIITNYFLTNIDFEGKTIGMFFSFLPFIGVPFMIAAWYLFIKISFEIINREISLRFTLWFFIILIIVFLSFGFLVPYINYFNVNALEINMHVFLFFILIEIITLIIVFSNYFVFSKKLNDKYKLRFVKIFAVLNLSLYLASGIFLLLGEKDSMFISGYIMLYFFKDIIPLILLAGYLNRYYIHPTNIVSENTRKSFTEQYNISKRETEIIDEIIQGKTNKEISERLFISLQTVKDHTHNIFLKTEVKNRVQLSNLIRQYNHK